jgi:signal transduction histidine kinase
LEDRARVEDNLGRQREMATETTYRIVRPDGSTRWIRDRSFPVRDASGHVRRVVGLAEDVTTLVKTEERLRQAARLDALGRLAGGVAHDFNNLLCVMLSYVDLILGSPGLSAQQREDLGVVRDAGASASALTRQLLTFSQQQTAQPRSIDVGRALAGLERILRRLLREDTEIVLVLAPTTAAVRVDPAHLEQVVINLTVNARDAMPRGGRLTISTADVVVSTEEAGAAAGLTAGRYVKLTVTDNGTGMTPETRAHIFEPFFTTKERGRGTGLGLATVFGIVDKCGGAIQVDSEPGRGTAFTIYLPAADAPAVTSAATAAARDPLRGSETVLLVEDDPQVRAVARTLLSRHGYEVLDAVNPGEALLICEIHSGAIDLLVTDVVMPLMSGPQLARRLATLRPAMKVLYTSGYGRESMAPDDGIAEDDAFVAKPFTPLELTRRVREVLDARPEKHGDRA